MRIYPVQEGDEPVMLSPDGRIVPSVVWYGEGGPGQTRKRRYPTEGAALNGELNLMERWNKELEAEAGIVSVESRPFNLIFKASGKDCFTVMLGEDENDGVDTGFTVKKSEAEEWTLWYDGAVWTAAKEWEDVFAAIVRIRLHAGLIIERGPAALKDFTASFSWRDKARSSILLDRGKPTGFIIRPSGGGFFCYHHETPEEILPTKEAAQRETVIRYAGEKFNTLII
jgi:hypothetical protein